MTEEEVVRQVADRMRAAGWRGEDEDRLLRTAGKRVALATRHEDQAEQLASKGALLRWTLGPDRRSDPRWVAAARLAAQNSELVLVHRVRAAACLLLITRPERDAALKLVPAWTLSVDELLDAARVLLR